MQTGTYKVVGTMVSHGWRSVFGRGQRKLASIMQEREKSKMKNCSGSRLLGMSFFAKVTRRAIVSAAPWTRPIWLVLVSIPAMPTMVSSVTRMMRTSVRLHTPERTTTCGAACPGVGWTKVVPHLGRPRFGQGTFGAPRRAP